MTLLIYDYSFEINFVLPLQISDLIKKLCVPENTIALF